MNKIDRIKGALYGFALGDALGVGTEFMTREEVKAYYPDGLKKFDQIIRDAHRCQWEPGEWTNDTLLLFSFMEPILDSGEYNLNTLALNLKQHIKELEHDLTSVYRLVMSTPGWEDNPVKVAHNIWQKHGLTEASNDSVHRGLVTGLLSSKEDIDDRTRQLVLMTNDDTRCVSSAMMIARMANSLLHTGEPASYKDLIAICNPVDTRTIPFLDIAYHGSIENLDLDDPDTLSWTRKCMAAALWPIWHCDNAEDSLGIVIHEGGDANTNAALAGALAGLRYGYDALPDEKRKIAGAERLDRMADQIVEYLTGHNRF